MRTVESAGECRRGRGGGRESPRIADLLLWRLGGGRGLLGRLAGGMQ
jgi:hypothetical protein